MGLAQQLAINVIAEGVEDPEALAVVSSTGVRYAQGYCSGAPARSGRRCPCEDDGVDQSDTGA